MIVDWAIDLPIFFITSILLSSVGLGGGAFYVPLLLALGYAFPEASATSLFLITVTGFLAFSRFRRARLVDWQLAVVMDVSETSVRRYLADFTQVATLCDQGFSENQIRLIAKKSNRIVREYKQLYETYKAQDNVRLQQLVSPEPVGEDAKKKSVAQPTSGGGDHE